MYCPNCGREIDSQSKFCSYCGKELNQSSSQSNFQYDPQNNQEFYQNGYGTPQYPYQQTPKYNTLSIIGFILSFFVSLAGFICSIIAYHQIGQTQEEGKGFAIAGIAIGIASFAINVISLPLAILLL